MLVSVCKSTRMLLVAVASACNLACAHRSHLASRCLGVWALRGPRAMRMALASAGSSKRGPTSSSSVGVSRPASSGDARPSIRAGAGARSAAATASGRHGGSSASAGKARDWGVPPSLAAKLDTWGDPFVRTVDAARRAWLSAHGCPATWPSAQQLRVGTDCSGAEAPIWALRGMGIPHVHVFSCDIEPRVRSFIEATSCPAGPIYPDMLSRDLASLPACSAYVCGFPCKAFSMLRRHSTQLLKEKTAKPFFEVVRVVRHRRPLLAVLENVRGITAVLPQILAKLRDVPGYFVFVVPIDSTHLGEPVSRPRYYFLLVRQDAAVTRDVSSLAELVKGMYTAAGSSVVDHVSKRMLPETSAAVKEFTSSLQARSRKRKARESGSQGVSKSHRPLSPAAPGWAAHLTPRAQVVIEAAKRKAATRGTADFIVDASQAEHRANARFDGICPTLTPHGLVVVGRAARIIMPIEKLMLHGFPVHRMSIPASTLDSVLASLGGNTMHVKSVGLALLIGIGLIDWGHGSARPGAPASQGDSPATPPAVFPLGDITQAAKVRKRPAKAQPAKGTKRAFGRSGVPAPGRGMAR